MAGKYERFVALKDRHDPENMLRLNPNINQAGRPKRLPSGEPRQYWVCNRPPRRSPVRTRFGDDAVHPLTCWRVTSAVSGATSTHCTAVKDVSINR
jgi:hypothetical protein